MDDNTHDILDKVLFAIVFVVIFLAVLLGCAPSVPHWRHRCVDTQTVTSMAFTDRGPVPVVTTICMRYDSTWVVPDTTR